MSRAAAYRTIWRWHFYAGLFVLPFVLILSVTGGVYLFKPQIERWEERAWLNLGTEGAVSPDRQLAAALAAEPGARFNHYRLPRATGDAAMIQLAAPGGQVREVYVSPQGRVLGTLDPDARLAATVARIHGTLLLGNVGDLLVELVASWTIIMILTGLYLWWPRPFRAAGTLWPRLSLRGRPLLRDLHRVLGFWIAGLALVMLASGLPWAGAWGSAFKWARSELGLLQGPQDWKIGVDGDHVGHHDRTMSVQPAAPPPAGLPLSAFVAKAAAERMAYPVLVLPPHALQQFGPPTGDEWTVKSRAQNRTLMRQVSYDPITGAQRSRRGFADGHIVDRIVNVGVAWHEGQLFGLANQLIGLATALSLITISLLGVWMWWRRRPENGIGAPRRVPNADLRGFYVLLVAAGVLLPLLGISLVLIFTFDRLVRNSPQREPVRHIAK